MNDLLALILVGLVVATAVISIIVILTGPSEPYSDTDYPPSSRDSGADSSRAAGRPVARSAEHRTSAASSSHGNEKASVRTRTSGNKNKEGVTG